MKLLNCYLLAK